MIWRARGYSILIRCEYPCPSWPITWWTAVRGVLRLPIVPDIPQKCEPPCVVRSPGLKPLEANSWDSGIMEHGLGSLEEPRASRGLGWGARLDSPISLSEPPPIFNTCSTRPYLNTDQPASVVLIRRVSAYTPHRPSQREDPSSLQPYVQALDHGPKVTP